MSALHLASLRLFKLWIPLLSHLLAGKSCKMSLMFIFYVLGFSYDFIVYTNITHIEVGAR